MSDSTRGSATGVRRIATEADARDLAHLLLTRGRTRPVIVVTIAGGRDEPFGDPDRIKESVGDLADVVLMPTSDISWAFSRRMPAQTQVYGGAGRVYPVDDQWTSQPELSRLRFAYAPTDRNRITEQLIDDAFAAALAAGLLGPRARPGSVAKAGIVKALVGSRAMVELSDHQWASVWEELTLPGVPLDRLLAPGQRVRGVYDVDARRLDLREGLRFGDAEAASAAVADAYEPGDIVLADVADVGNDTVRLRLLPELEVDVDREAVTSNPNDVLRDLFTIGEIVACRLSGLDPVRLRLDDIDDDERPRTAPSLFADGPPWLRPPVPTPPPPPEPPTVIEVSEPQPAAARPLQRRPSPLDVARRAGTVASQAAPGHPHTAEAGTPLECAVTETPIGTAPVPVVHAGLDMQERVVQLTNLLGAEHATREKLATSLQGLSAELGDLRNQASDLERQLNRATEQIKRLQTQYRNALLARQRAEARLKDARTEAPPPPDDAGAFLDRAEQFRFEVYLEWVHRIPAAEKANKPLAEYRLLDGFLDSVEAIKGISRAKVVAVVVEILTKQANNLAGRDIHMLRNGSPGSPPVTRADGAVCWRVALQREAASARRLHYWHTGDDVYEFSRVALHDDFRP